MWKIQEVVKDAGNMLVALRLVFEGASKAADKMMAYPKRLEQEIRSIGAEVAGDELWVERVEIKARRLFDLNTAIEGNDALGNLLNEILKPPELGGTIIGLDEVIDELRKKLPLEAVLGLGLDTDKEKQRLTEEAKDLLTGRMLTGDVE